MSEFSMPSRRSFVTAAGSGLALIGTPWGVSAQVVSTPAASSPNQRVEPPRPDPLAASVVQEFVRKAHSDLSATKTLLAEQPKLLNATWDWGAGDFETGLGGAGHMGNREIAEYLIGQGARLDIFVATMLGRIEIVRAMLTAWPDLLHSRGPHGISLMKHAQAGKEGSAAVVDYLKSLGAE
jgi:hypothetical protein